eukprot:s4705_g2.t1
MYPAVLQHIHLKIEKEDCYPFRQNHYKVHITGAPIGSNYVQELKRLAWHLDYHQAEVLSLPPINTKRNLEDGTATMERQSKPIAVPPVKTNDGQATVQISPLSERHSNSLEAVSKHTLTVIQGYLYAAAQASNQAVNQVPAVQDLTNELQEAHSLAIAALEAHPAFFGLHDDYQDLDIAI